MAKNLKPAVAMPRTEPLEGLLPESIMAKATATYQVLITANGLLGYLDESLIVVDIDCADDLLVGEALKALSEFHSALVNMNTIA